MFVTRSKPVTRNGWRLDLPICHQFIDVSIPKKFLTYPVPSIIFENRVTDRELIHNLFTIDSNGRSSGAQMSYTTLYIFVSFVSVCKRIL